MTGCMISDCPHNKGRNVNEFGAALNLRNSFIALAAENVVLTAVKKAEDSGALILRFYEWAGKDGEVRIRIPNLATSARLADLLEQPEGSPLSIEHGDILTVPAHPYEIVTVKVEYPTPAQLPASAKGGD